MFQLYIFKMNLFSSDVSHERASKGGFNQKKTGGLRSLMASNGRIYSVVTSGQMWKRLKPTDVSEGEGKNESFI